MSHTPINHDQAKALAAFIHTIRPDWDAAGILAALGYARERGNTHDIAIAAIRAATDHGNRTPAIIHLDGPHWRSSDATTPRRPVHPDRLCSICSNPEPRCRELWTGDHEFLSVADHHAQVRTTTTPPAGVADRIAGYDKAAAEALEAGALGRAEWYSARAQLLERRPASQSTQTSPTEEDA